jgi:hypothetical protein
VAKEVKAARWAGVEPRPTRQQIDKAASVFEARRISDRRRLAELLKYMNTQDCRVQMLRSYFDEEDGGRCGLCDSCAGLDSEVFDPGEDDARHGLHAATDFHGRSRRRRRRGEKKEGIARPSVIFPTAIPDLPAPVVPPPWVAPPESDRIVDETVWQGELAAGRPAIGEVVLEQGETEAYLAELANAPVSSEPGPDFAPGWSAVRDANIRPYVEWIAPTPFSLPVANGNRGGQPPQQQQQQQQNQKQGNRDHGGGGDGGRRRRKRSRHGNRHRHGGNDRDRRGPRLPGMYNPGGD